MSTEAADAAVVASVKEYYGKVLSSTKDLKTSACTTAGKPPAFIIDVLEKVPSEVTDKYYGCGTPLPGGIEGLSVLDLGSGSGRDCYIAAALVGEAGKVVGIDMTDEQLTVAREHAETFTTSTLGYAANNLSFATGYIEAIASAGVPDASVDLVISNCVINLSPDKDAVLQGTYNALREGGELYFSDVYSDRRIPEAVRQHKVLWGECLSGALYIEDFKRICHKVGFSDPRQLSISEIEVHDPELKAITGNIKFYSILYRCFKIKSLETLCEDYGQVAYYNGTIQGSPDKYALDDHHIFETNKPMLVCGNTASMVEDSWLKPHFKVVGDRSHHFGLFPCGPAPTAAAAVEASSCAPGGACC